MSTYWELMDAYDKECAVMSFVCTKNPNYQALKSKREAILPELIDDIRTRRGNTWVAMHLVFDIVGRENGPVVPEKDRGKVDKICKIILDWYEDRTAPCHKLCGHEGAHETFRQWYNKQPWRTRFLFWIRRFPK